MANCRRRRLVQDALAVWYNSSELHKDTASGNINWWNMSFGNIAKGLNMIVVLGNFSRIAKRKPSFIFANQSCFHAKQKTGLYIVPTSIYDESKLYVSRIVTGVWTEENDVARRTLCTGTKLMLIRQRTSVCQTKWDKLTFFLSTR